MKNNGAISFGQNVCFLTSSVFLTQKIKREIPKMMPDYPKKLPDNELSIISTHSYYQATFLGLFLRSQKVCLKIVSTHNDCHATFLGFFFAIPKIIPDN